MLKHEEEAGEGLILIVLLASGDEQRSENSPNERKKVLLRTCHQIYLLTLQKRQ